MTNYEKLKARLKTLEANPFANTTKGSELYNLRQKLRLIIY